MDYLHKITVCLCNINWICGQNMASILNSFYYHSFHLTTNYMKPYNYVIHTNDAITKHMFSDMERYDWLTC